MKIFIKHYSFDKTPNDCLEYAEMLNGICGEASIAALFETNLKMVFKKGCIDEKQFKGFTTQKEMRGIISKFGYGSKQKRIGNKYILPDCDFGIIRVSFGEQNQHWMKTAQLSHYIAIKRFKEGRFIFDNAIDRFEGIPRNLWIEKSEYNKVMSKQKMFITSYLEIFPLRTKRECDND